MNIFLVLNAEIHILYNKGFNRGNNNLVMVALYYKILSDSNDKETLENLFININEHPASQRLLIKALEVLNSMNATQPSEFNGLRIYIDNIDEQGIEGSYCNGDIRISRDLSDRRKLAHCLLNIYFATQTIEKNQSDSLLRKNIRKQLKHEMQFTDSIITPMLNKK